MSKPARRRFDDDEDQYLSTVRIVHETNEPDREPDHPSEREADDVPGLSTYVDAAHGPDPVPPWVITSADALDVDLGVMKTGKEADVSLLRRTHGDDSVLLAVKQYRSAEHRMFHRDAGYLEGRRERRSRDTRAMASRTEYGRELLAGRWAAAEFEALSRLWQLGAAVPYPVQLIGTELMMEFVGTRDGVAAPRLAQIRPGDADIRQLWEQLRTVLIQLADVGLAHGDLSPYNVLVDGGRLVLIDLPQAIDLVTNPQGFAFLRRDCENICSWFASRGVDADAGDLEHELRRVYRHHDE